MGYVGKDPKKCTECGVFKPRSNFGPHGKARGGVRSPCKLCESVMQKAKYKLNPSNSAKIQRRSRIKVKYGLTMAGYESILESQGGMCAICGTNTPGGRCGDAGPVFSVDHCHTTGRIRGLLCTLCNTALGGFKDNQLFLCRAIEYLKKGG